MKTIHYFVPTKQALLIGAAVGIATKEAAVGSILILIFSLAFNIKESKK